MRLLLVTLLLFVFTSSFGQNVSDSLDFSLIFTECYKDDTISVKLNGVPILERRVITSDSADGVAYHIFQSKSALWIDSNRRVSKVRLKNRSLLDVEINSFSERFYVNLKRGRYILISKCNGRGNFLGWKSLSLSQSEQAPIFD